MESIHEGTNATSEQTQESVDEPDSEFIISKNFKGIRKKVHGINTKFENHDTQNRVLYLGTTDTLTTPSLESFPNSLGTDFSINSDLKIASAG